MFHRHQSNRFSLFLGGILPVALLLLALIGLPGLNHPGAILARDDDKADWTILIYGHGDHDLAVGLVEDMLEMEKAGSTDKFHIIIQTDFDSSQEEDLVEAGLPAEWAKGSQRIRITKAPKENKDGDQPKLISKVLQTLPEQDMDDPAVLGRFLSWAMEKYPSKRVGLILNDHGDQWYGFGGDTQDGDRDEPKEISLSDLRKTLQKVIDRNRGGKPLDFIALDCCLMGSAEVLSELHTLCQLLIANAEIDYGYGLDYEATFQWLKNNPQATMAEFAKAESEAWKAHQFRKEEPAPSLIGSHSCYDCSKGPDLERAVEAFTKALLEQPTDNPRFLPSTRRLSTEYGLEPATLGEPSDYVDLGEFASRIAATASAPAPLKEAAEELSEVIENLVLYHIKGELREKATGLSIWYPTSGRPRDIPVEEAAPKKSRQFPAPEPGSPEAIFAKYRRISFSQKTGWSKWLDRVNREAKKVRDFKVQLPKKIADDGIGITKGKTAKIPFTLTRARTAWKADLFLYAPPTQANSSEWAELGWISKVQLEGNGRYQLNLTGKIPHLVSADGKKRVPLSAESLNEEGTLLASKFHYDPPKNRKNHEGELISILWTCKGDKIKPLVAISADEEGGSVAEVSLKPGGKLTLMRTVEIRKGDNPDDWDVQLRRTGEIFEIPQSGISGLKAELAPIPVGRHELLLVVDDVYGVSGAAESIPLVVVEPK